MTARDIFWNRDPVERAGDGTWLTRFHFFVYGREVVTTWANIQSDGVSEDYANRIAEAMLNGLKATARGDVI